MRVVTAFLCDAATIRDGLLNVLGAGVTRTFSKEYPTNLGVAFACILEARQGEDPEAQYQMVIRVVNDTHEHELFSATARFNLSYKDTPDEGLPGALPFAVGLGRTELPEPGRYHVLVTLDDDEPAWSTTFVAYRGTLEEHEPFVPPTAPLET